jgi:VanZ family protein
MRRWWPVVAWWVFQFTLTTLPGGMFPTLNTRVRLDWIAHFGMYSVLAGLLVRATLMDTVLGAQPLRRLMLMGLALSVLGALDELHQFAVPGRSAEVGDWIVDSIGVAAGLALGTLLMRTPWAARWLR